MAGIINRIRNSSSQSCSMGSCESSQASLVDLSKRNKEIEIALEKERKEGEGLIKLLLLGAAESGKSTILKQMKIIHDNGFSNDEMKRKKNMVYSNTIWGMISFIDAMRKLGSFYTGKDSAEHEIHLRKVIEKAEDNNPFSERTYKALTALWQDKGIQDVKGRKTEVYLNDSAEYFLDSLERIYDKNFEPTVMDVIRTRVSTMGVIEVSFRMKNKNWRVFDVGGQRSQRKKWIHCFDDVKAVIYVAALSEYDQLLREDMATNRMKESIQLFENVCNNKHFINTNMILFLNKKDLFIEKITVVSLRRTFPEYTGKDTFEDAIKYIERRFMKQNKNPQKTIYCHHTCATDTRQVEFVLDSTLDTILSAKLKGCGLY